MYKYYYPLFILFFASSLPAQIVLNPPEASGSIEKNISTERIIYSCFPLTCYCGTYDVFTNTFQHTHWMSYTTLKVYHNDYGYIWPTWSCQYQCPSGAPCGHRMHCLYLMFDHFYWDHQTIIEFDISSLSGMGVTRDNFVSAELNNFQISSLYHPGESMLFHIYNLNDNSEDGVISDADHSNFSAPPIATFFTANGFSHIDVTNEIYKDMFVPGCSGAYSGFVLCNHLEQNNWAIFERDPISLEITIKEAQVPSLSLFSFLFLLITISVYVMTRYR